MAAIQLILTLLSGVALFLFGMSLMGDGLKKVAGKSLEQTLFKLTSTPIKGVLLGTIVTAVIQSSSATTVMVVGFVNSGMMQVAQAIGVIMGANIGTSITGWILCLSYIDGESGIATLLSTATISAIVAVIGIILKSFTKKSVYHNIGDIMLGFAILMMGMQTMSGAVSPLKQNETFVNTLTMFKNPFLGILIGILFTAILQSASASIGILQALSMTGAISFASAFPITLGIGIGAAVPVLLSAIGTNNNGKRTALVYLTNDVLGCVIWGTIFYVVNAFAHFTFMDVVMSPVLIALLNTVYRMATVIVLFPFIKQIEKLVFLFVKDSAEDIEEQADFDLLEERFLAYPELAISQSHKALDGMAATAEKNIDKAIELLSDYGEKKYSKVQKKEKLLDKYEDKLSAYLMVLSKQPMNTKETTKVTEFLHSVTDFERLGDHASNIADVAQQMAESNMSFSEAADEEFEVINGAIREIVTLSVNAFKHDDMMMARKVEPLREWINALSADMKTRHIKRLQKGQCDIEAGMLFNDVLNNYERIGAHCSNIAVAIMEINGTDVDTHEVVRSMRKSVEYQTILDVYQEKYSLKEVKKKKKKSKN